MTLPQDDARGSLARLVRRLDLREASDDRFHLQPIAGEGRLFGGLVAALAVAAAGRTAPGHTLHSLHGYFLRRGRHHAPIELAVERLRDGHALAVRRVELRHGGVTSFAMLASFTRAHRGVAHQEAPMPEVPPPETLPDWEDVRVAAYGVARRPDGPLEIRECEPASATPLVGRAARRRVWMRPRGTVPDDPLLHAALLVFASDRNFLSTAARPHGLVLAPHTATSLDHAVWLHARPRFDDWVLYASESPVAEGGRGFVHGSMYTRDGKRIASVAQEGLIRRPG